MADLMCHAMPFPLCAQLYANVGRCFGDLACGKVCVGALHILPVLYAKHQSRA